MTKLTGKYICLPLYLASCSLWRRAPSWERQIWVSLKKLNLCYYPLIQRENGCR